MKKRYLKFIEEQLMLYSIREAKIEDMKLEIEELELEITLDAQQYGERVQTSSLCPNNDSVLYKKQYLEQTIKYYELSNKRTKNYLNFIGTKKAKEVIENLCILKKSKSEISRLIDRSRKQVNNLYNKGIEEIYLGVYEEPTKKIEGIFPINFLQSSLK